MQITLRLSRFNDLDLYAYFMGVEYRRSTLVKQLLRDYIRREHTVRLEAPNISAQTFTDPAIEKQITIPVTLGKSDEDIIQYLSDCPNRMRGKCVKSILRMMLAPYTQCAYHFSPVTPYAPYCDRPPIAQMQTGVDMTQLFALLLGQNLQQGQNMMPAAGSQSPYPNMPEPEFCQPSRLPQMPVTRTTEEVPFGRVDGFPVSAPVTETSQLSQNAETVHDEKPADREVQSPSIASVQNTGPQAAAEKEDAPDAPSPASSNTDAQDDALLAIFGVDY